MNQAYADSRSQPNGSSSSKPRRVPIHYKHTKQIDLSYSFPHEANSRAAKKVRVTKNDKGEVVATIIKENMGHLNIYSPRTMFDWRISINNERNGTRFKGAGADLVQLPPGMDITSERRKDRLTYMHQHCQIDLTQVTNVCHLTITVELINVAC